MSSELTSPARPRGLLKRWFPRRYKRARVILVIVIILIILRILLPYILLWIINDRLAKVPGYYGHVEDVDVALIRGAYSLHEAYLNEVDSVTNEQTPFIAVKKVDLSIEWGELFRGSIVGEVVAESLVVKFTKDKMEPAQVKEDKNILVELGEDFMPLKLNRVEINRSSIHYIDQTSSPKLDIKADNVFVLAENLRTEKDTVLLPSTLLATANIYGGTFMMRAKMDMLADDPTFDMDAQVNDVNLVELNPFFQAYAKLDVNKGTFGMYLEAASRNGALKGYVKPILKDLDVLGKEDRDDDLLRKVWEGFVGSVRVVFTNWRHDQFATKVPFSGTLKKAEIDIWFSIFEVLRNAFIQAISSKIDFEININSPGTDDKKKGLKGLFKKEGGDKEDDKKGGKTDAEKAARREERQERREDRKEAREEKSEERAKERELKEKEKDQ